MKVCTKCGKDKELEEFSPQSTGKDGLRASCRECNSKQSRTYQKENPKVVNKEVQRNSTLKYLYGITIEDYNTLFIAQKGCCGICGKHQVELSRQLSVDHDHKTKIVRGLLCDNCNHGLGKFLDNKELLTKAIEYLK